MKARAAKTARRAPRNRGRDLQRVTAILQQYADRGVFRGFSSAPARDGKAAFKIVWHRNQTFDLIVDTRRATMSFPALLRDFDASMTRELSVFVASRQSKDLPEHRRVDPKKAVLRCSRRAGDAGLTLALKSGDAEYGIRKLIHLVHEIFLTFLSEGRYYEYQVKTFDLDPDHL